MAKGDTFGDTFRVAKQVRGCQNLGEIQANTTDNPLPERAIPQKHTLEADKQSPPVLICRMMMSCAIMAEMPAVSVTQNITSF